ncbi:MAG TPA: hypothetical protein VLF67_00605 [Candidatus Saccharimonas sp.]|nr:hypothetical protein [Candidatus Saccharimonas sp.]
MNRKVVAYSILGATAVLTHLVRQARQSTHTVTFSITQPPRINLVGLPIKVIVRPGTEGEVKLVLSGRWPTDTLPFTVDRSDGDVFIIRGQAPVGARPALDRSSRLTVYLPLFVAELNADSCADLTLPSWPLRLNYS